MASRSASSNRVLAEYIEETLTSLKKGGVDFNYFKPLLTKVFATKVQHKPFWRLLASLVGNTQHAISKLPAQILSTASILNSPEKRADVEELVKRELGHLDVDYIRLIDEIFGSKELEDMADKVFNMCQKNHIYLPKSSHQPNLTAQSSSEQITSRTRSSSTQTQTTGSWDEWPSEVTEKTVLPWLQKKIGIFTNLAKGAPNEKFQILGKAYTGPKLPVKDSQGKRQLDIAIVSNKTASTSSNENENTSNFDSNDKPASTSSNKNASNFKNNEIRQQWSKILVPGELKNNEEYDTASSAWSHLALYV